MKTVSVETIRNYFKCNIYNHDKPFRQKLRLFNPKKKKDVFLKIRYNALFKNF